jgi:hypothetical protein
MRETVVTDQDVINAFVTGSKAESPALRSDGLRLYAEGEAIAEWSAQRLVIEPRRQAAAAERCKDLLTHAILLRSCWNQEVRRLLNRNCRELLPLASSAGRPSA